MPYDLIFQRNQSTIKGIDISWLDSGENKAAAIIFVHGLGSSAEVWDESIRALRGYFRCIAIDLPGHGLSSKKSNYAYTPAFFANIIAGLAQSLAIHQFHLAGHSMGGQIAIALALMHSHSVNKLALVAPAGFEVFSERDIAALIQFSEMKVESSFFKNTLPDNFPQFAQANPGFSKPASTPPEILAACMKGMLYEPVFMHLPQIKAKTLVVFGEKDDYIPNKYLHPLLNTRMVAGAGAIKIPGAQLRFIPLAGHYIQLDAPQEFNDLLKRFLLE